MPEISRYRDFIPAGEQPAMPLQRVQMGKDAKGRPVITSTCADFIPGEGQIAEQKAKEAELPAMLKQPGKKPVKMSNADRKALAMGERFAQHYIKQPKNIRAGIVRALHSQQALGMILKWERMPDLKKLIEGKMLG